MVICMSRLTVQRCVYVPPRRKTRTRRYGSSLYKRYAEDTPTTLCHRPMLLLLLLNLGLHWMVYIRTSDRMIPLLESKRTWNPCLYQKPTNTGLPLHFQSDVDKPAIRRVFFERGGGGWGGRVWSQVNSAYALSSATVAFKWRIWHVILYILTTWLTIQFAP